jgi:hypothetical protein
VDESIEAGGFTIGVKAERHRARSRRSSVELRTARRPSSRRKGFNLFNQLNLNVS